MMIPTIKVMRPDGKGYHLVNAPAETPVEQPQEAASETPAPKPAPKKRAPRKKEA